MAADYLMVEPYMRAWADQFGALLRDKCRQMIQALEVTHWETCAHVFHDDDGDEWRLTFHQGHFLVTNISDPEAETVVLDIKALGVIK